MSTQLTQTAPSTSTLNSTNAKSREELYRRWAPTVFDVAAERNLLQPPVEWVKDLIWRAHESMVQLYLSALADPSSEVLYRHVEQFIIDAMEASSECFRARHLPSNEPTI